MGAFRLFPSAFMPAQRMVGFFLGNGTVVVGFRRRNSGTLRPIEKRLLIVGQSFPNRKARRSSGEACIITLLVVEKGQNVPPMPSDSFTAQLSRA